LDYKATERKNGLNYGDKGPVCCFCGTSYGVDGFDFLMSFKF